MLHIINGTTLTEQGLQRADVGIDGTEIDEVAAGLPRGGPVVDAAGLLVLPGIVDIHGDAFERSLMPRPGVGFDERIAFLDMDRQMLANGITTAFHGVTMSWEPGLRSTASAARIVAAIEELRAGLDVDTHVHLRHETFNLDAEPMLLEWLAAGRIGCLAFNDHMEGTIKTRQRPDKIRKHIERTGLSDEAFFALVDRVHARAPEVMASLRRLAAAAREAGVPVLSHDDMTPAMRDGFRAMGVRVAEFPINEETARNAGHHADAIVFGAPNVLRGGSHTGCPSAAAMVRAGLCTVLASDYYHPALLHAAFHLVEQGDADLATAWNLVSAGPAAALGLTDRGVIAAGKRADVILVDASRPKGERVIASVIKGRIRLVTEPNRLRA